MTEELNLEFKRAQEYLEAMHQGGSANKEDCANVQMHLDNIYNLIQEPVLKDCSTCKFKSVSKYVEPCFNCRDNGGYDNYKSKTDE